MQQHLLHSLKSAIIVKFTKFLVISIHSILLPFIAFWGSKILIKATVITVFENHRKSLIQHCERSELRLHFEWTKVH